MKNKNTHPLDVGYLVMGLIFLGIAGTWALHQAEVVELSEMEWLLPVGLIVAGAIGLVASAATSRSRRRAARQAAEHGEPYDEQSGDWVSYPGYDAALYDAPHDAAPQAATPYDTAHDDPGHDDPGHDDPGHDDPDHGADTGTDDATDDTGRKDS